jgi:radical SAM protein with 4Fe4S-binding SPASM domain
MRQPAGLSLQGWRQILDTIRPHARALKITGGEPTLHPQFAELLAEIDSLSVPFTLFTNARWRQPEHMLGLLQGATNLDGLLVSLHGADAETHETFSGVAGAFEETCANIRRAAERGLRVHISTVLNAFNLHQLAAVVELARSLGAQRVVFNRFLGTGDSSFQPSEAALLKAIQEIERLRRRYPVRADGRFSVRYGNCIPQCFTESGASGCWAGVSYCTIDPWGRLRPCNHSPTVVGSLFEHSLEELWHGQVMQRWRQLTPDACLACGAYERCHGSCRALMELERTAQDPLMRSPIPSLDGQDDVEIYRYAKPKLASEMLPAEPGMALVKGLSIFPVSDDAIPLLNDLDGNKTLAQVLDAHGQVGLDFVGELLLRGYVYISE